MGIWNYTLVNWKIKFFKTVLLLKIDVHITYKFGKKFEFHLGTFDKKQFQLGRATVGRLIKPVLSRKSVSLQQVAMNKVNKGWTTMHSSITMTSSEPPFV